MIESKFSRNVHLAPHATMSSSCRHTPGVKSLPPRGTAAGAWFERQGRAARRQDLAAVPHDDRVFFIF
jgi:hypothetical protein